MKLSCCVWAMNFGRNRWMRYFRTRMHRPVSETYMLDTMVELGFRSVDIQPYMQRSETTQSFLKQNDVQVACMSLSFFAPDGGNLHSKDSTKVESLMNYLKEGIDHTAQIGVDRAYVVPGKNDKGVTIKDIAPHYAELASYGASKGVKIAIEHFPDTALPTIQATLKFIQQINHPNLYLLFDIGHAQISNEEPAVWLPITGDRLLYVHLDDNDGKGDLHLPLTEGVQSRNDLDSLFNVLQEMNYTGPISLELHPQLKNPFEALRRSKQIVEDLYSFE